MPEARVSVINKSKEALERPRGDQNQQESLLIQCGSKLKGTLEMPIPEWDGVMCNPSTEKFKKGESSKLSKNKYQKQNKRKEYKRLPK